MSMIDVKANHGAVGDGVIDDTQAFKHALVAAGPEKWIYVPGGTYIISEPLNMNTQRMVGVRSWRNNRGSILKVDPNLTAPLSSVIESSNNAFQLESITIDCNSKADKGIHAHTCHGPIMRLVNVEVRNAMVVGFHFEFSMMWYGECLVAKDNRGDGFWIEDANGATLVHTEASGNIGIGIQVYSPTGSRGGCHLIGGKAEENHSHGIVVRSTTGTCTIEKFWIGAGSRTEQIAVDGVRINGAHHVTVRDCRISGYTDGTNQAIRLMGNSSNCRIRDNDAAPSGTVDDTLDLTGSQIESYATVEVESGCELNDVTGNRRISTIVTSPLAVNYTDRANTAQRVQAHADSRPTAGTWKQGDIVWNQNPVPNGEVGWVCVAGGTAPTWKRFGRIRR